MASRDLDALDHIFQAAGDQYGIDPALLKAHAYVESGINPNVGDSPQGAVGIMQILPSTAAGLGIKDPRDPKQAIPAAAKYLAEGFDKTGNAQDAVMYYHGGPDRRGWGPKTHEYLDKVAAAYGQFSGKPMRAEQPADAPKQVAAMSPEDLVKLYGGGGAPAISGSSDQPAGGPLTIRVKPNNPSGGLSPEALVQMYGSEGEGEKTTAPAREPGGMLNAVARGAVEGIPFVGPKVLKGINNIDALVRSAQNGSTLAGEMKAADAYGAATDAANPLAKAVGSVGGNVGAMVAASALPGGAALLGMRGPMLARSVAGGLSGAAIGAGDAYMRGEDPTRAGTIAGAAGLATPLVARTIGQAVAPVVNRLTTAAQDAFSGTARANNSLLAAMESAGQDTAAIRAELARNPNLSLADLNTGLRERLVGLGQGGPEAPAIRQFVEARRAAAGDQVRGGYANNIGAPPDPVALRETLSQTAQTNADNAFRPILRNAQPVSLDGLSQSSRDVIERARERALAPFTEDARNAMNEAQQLHLTQTQLRREAEALRGSAVGSERLAAGDVENVRQQLINRLDDATGGNFRPAQRQFADDMDVRQAFDNGMSALNRVRSGVNGLEDRPEALARDWHGMRQEEREAFREGMRTQIATIIENNRNPARAGEAVIDPGFNRQKLAIVFGDRQAGQLMQAVEDSRNMAATNNAIWGGADTAQRKAARESVRVRGDSAPAAGLEIPALAAAVGGPGAGAAATAVKGANKLAGILGRRSDVARNRLLAQDLMATGPEAEAVANRLDAFIARRAGARGATRQAIEQNRPLNLLIRAGGLAGAM